MPSSKTSSSSSAGTGRPSAGAGWLASAVAVAALVACGGGGGEPAGPLASDPVGNPGVATPVPQPGTGAPPLVSAPAAGPAPSAAPVAWGTPIGSARIFISGHSLTDQPADSGGSAQSLGNQLVRTANGLLGSDAARYNQQIALGSPIRVRTAGPANDRASWPGYSLGKNASGNNLNVLAELRNPATPGIARYDTLLITENHDSLNQIQYEDTVRHLRHYHERMIAAHPQARTFFYESWKDVRDFNDPSSWIAHERAQSRVWQCVTARVNTALAAEGRSDRIAPLPAGAALVALVEQALAGNVPGISAGSPAATLRNLFTDAVHLSTAGFHYVALVSYSAIYQRSPVGAPVPAGLSPATAAALQQAAWSFVSNFYASYREPQLDACRTEVAQNFCSTYWNYRGQGGNAAGCSRTFSAASNDNPFWFDRSANASYWFPAP